MARLITQAKPSNYAGGELDKGYPSASINCTNIDLHYGHSEQN